MQISKPPLALQRDLGRLLRPDQVSQSLPDRLSYGRDSNSKAILWVRHNRLKYPPDVIVWPESVAEVSRLAAFAQAQGIPLIPFGGGSGVCGGTWALRGGIALDLKRMDKIFKVDTREMKVRAQTGVNGEILERQLKRRGLTLGHFPSSIYVATLGGYLACRSAGQFSTQYGKIEDMVEGLEVVLADGQVIQVGDVRESPGAFDLKELFLGSEGTLGILTEATLRVHPQPETDSYLAFGFSHLEKALAATRELMQRGLVPALVRVYDELDSLLFTSGVDGSKDSYLDLLSRLMKPALRWAKDASFKIALKHASWVKPLLEWLPTSCLMVLGFQGEATLTSAQARLAREICLGYRAKDLGEKPGRYWLQHRYSVSYKLSPLFDEGFFADTMEVATTWNNLMPLYRAIRKALSEQALVLAHFSHAYEEGCSIYFTFLAYRDSEESSETLYDQLWDKALRACTEAGGTISHHHGVGVLKAAYMRKEWGEAFGWLCNIKNKLDPKGILNPGKLGFDQGVKREA
jgi:alkyldihydroxyacetonephosphate synthase